MLCRRFLGACLSILTLASSPAVFADEPLLVYSARAEQLIKSVFEQFTKETGIEVRYFNGNEGALIERLKKEGDRAKADLLLTVDAGNLWYAAEQGLLAPFDSEEIAARIPAHLRDSENRWTALSLRARTIVYSTERVDPGKDHIASYADLARPEWQDRLCLRSSKKVYNKSLVASMIAHLGEDKTAAIVDGWVENLALRPLAEDSQVMEAILAGQCDAGIINSYYFGRLQAGRPDVPLALQWANQDSTGTHINVSGAGILKYAPQAEKAQQLLTWLTGPSAQGLFAAINKEFPANSKSPIDRQVHEWGPFKQDELPLEKLGELQARATRLMQKARYR
ncbi:extracellular solute-binding protein [Granulosicoccaceae sp. 1_MG-2023]|nr:extracellular solute-binding protein [Granulosicoccaceae sp. 1_MG-2023]